MKILAIVQARLGSTRLPGKVFLPLNGQPVILHVLSRLKACQNLHGIVLATTTEKQDDPLFAIAKDNEVLGFRGSEHHVLERFYLAAKKYSASHVVRICSDCPLLEPLIIDEMIRQFKELNSKKQCVDYLSNAVNRTFPRGLDAEIFSFKALETAYQNADLEYEKVHVTPYIYQHPDKFRLEAYQGVKDYSNYRWTLDTEKDYEFLNRIFTDLDIGLVDYPSWETVMAYLLQNPEIVKINEAIEQKPLEMC